MFFQEVENIEVSESGKRVSKYTTPVLIATCTKHKVRINAAASSLLDVGNRENIRFIKAKQPDGSIMFGVHKGYPVKDDQGNVIMVADRMTAKEAKARIEAGDYREDEDGRKIAIAPEVPKLTGSRMSITNGSAKRGAFGNTLEGTEATIWGELGGTVELNKVFELIGEGEEVTIDGEDLLVFPLQFLEDDAKAGTNE